jgi:hypothetical protein
MVARNSKDLMAAVAKAGKEATGILELLGPCALGEVAADYNQVGARLIDAFLDGSDQSLIMGAEMQV